MKHLLEVPKHNTATDRGLAASGKLRADTRASIFAIILLLILTGVAFLGYHYFNLSGEYRQRNFMHLVETKAARDIVIESPILRAPQIEQVRSHIETARAKAIWCTDNLNAVEYALIEQIGASRAFTLCREDVDRADMVLQLLARMKSQDANMRDPAQSPFARALEVRAIIEQMMEASVAFQPQVDLIQSRLSNVVIGGTTFVSFAMLIVMTFLLKELEKVWTRLLSSSERLKEINQRFGIAMEGMSDGFALFDKDRRLVMCNETYRRLAHPNPDRVEVGMTVEDIIRDAMSHGFYVAIPKEERSDFIQQHIQRLAEGDADIRLEIVGDRHVQEKLTESAVGDKVVIRTDVTSYVQANRKLQELTQRLESAKTRYRKRSLEDPMTEIANRRCLDEALRAAVGTGPRAIIRIDLDRFKRVNDMLGHDAGDHVLKTVARRLELATRDTDMVARVGGDEFVVLCAQGTDLDSANEIGQRLLATTLEPVLYEGRPCVFSASLGLAVKEVSADNPHEILQNADAALYEAKAAGRGDLKVFSREMEERIAQDRKISDDLIRAISAGELVPYYQTQHDAKTHAITGIEVLARWAHPEFGVLAPGAFLNTAQQMKLDGDIDTAIMSKAMGELDVLMAAGFRVPKTSFNVSAKTLSDPAFLGVASDLYRRAKQPISFEILESVSLEEEDQIIPFAIEGLRELGFDLEIDDFGSGHASIKSVMQVRPNALKIDRSIVLPLGSDPRTKKLVAATIDIGKALGINVIAEGVETPLHAKILADLGCNILQGYYFSKPMCAQDLSAFLVAEALPQNAH
ncbi:diguanylate cyclase (GGDEF)-like protein [Roseibium hamelinense]|uniref:Diguanylate cyclase (GGDEF)-like protein n=1 Tax=Roseibium hamelinense TaxID=150831 RepID=A0A562SFB3_9HYPH|nr:EAL domain-containing protein [Roseibium hamelinense]MTI44168.1 EAL domain-containing protein [Roseibium hamelinense]TWI80049.1 diguanylate cyclase (GGDEF)-like protein [Roseibium hamelinense]